MTLGPKPPIDRPLDPRQAPAEAAKPLFGELSLLESTEVERLYGAAKNLQDARAVWLRAAGAFVGAAIERFSGSPQVVSDLEAPKARAASNKIWAQLATHLSKSGRTGLQESGATIKACALFWCHEAKNLIQMHDCLADWPGRERTMLSRSLTACRSPVEMCQLLASFEVAGQAPPFAASAGVLLRALRDLESAEKAQNTDLSALPSLIAGGDVFLCRDLPGHTTDRGSDSVLLDLEPVLSAADIALANLEAVVSHNGWFASKGERRPYYFHSPPACINALIEAGITCVTAANNHALDYGPDAIGDQLKLLKSLGLPQAGAGWTRKEAQKPAFLNAAGLVVALIAFETETPLFAAEEASPGVFHLPINDEAPKVLAPIIAKAQKNADLVIVSPHWGPNWQSNPGPSIRRLAHAIIDLGADAILGHSAHVLQGVEVYQNRPIVYDMACLAADRVGEPAMRGSALFELRFDKTGVRRLVIRPLQLNASKTRFARGEVARQICDRIVGLSIELNPDIRWQHEDETLALDLPPPREPRQRQTQPRKLHHRQSVQIYKPTVRPPPPRFFPRDLPEALKGTKGVDMGGGLVVLGQRRASCSRTGYGFLVEVLFRCPQTKGRHWRANLRGQPEEAERSDFQYRHPVSEGLWASQDWASDRLISDAVVVRPPNHVKAGTYRLRWALVENITRRIWPAKHGPSPVGWVELGELTVGDELPKGVAGIDWDQELQWAPLTPANRSR